METTTNGSGYYILKGRKVIPASLMEWAILMKDDDMRQIALTTLGEVKISTVFLGLDHQFGDGPPILFETMVFGGRQDEYQRRYSTYDEAEQGHKGTINMLKL